MFVHQIHGYFAVVFSSQIWEVINPFTAGDVYILKYQGRKAPVESDEALNLALLHLRSGTEPDYDLALHGSHLPTFLKKILVTSQKMHNISKTTRKSQYNIYVFLKLEIIVHQIKQTLGEQANVLLTKMIVKFVLFCHRLYVVVELSTLPQIWGVVSL